MPLPSPVLNQINLRAPKGIVYGPPGVGKTTFGAGAGGLIVDTENGAAHVQCDRTPYLPHWPVIEQWLDALATGGHEYGAIVIDSVDWLLRRAEEHVAGVDGSATGMRQTLNRAHGGYGNGKLVLKNYVYQYLLPTLDQLVNAGIGRTFYRRPCITCRSCECSQFRWMTIAPTAACRSVPTLFQGHCGPAASIRFRIWPTPAPSRRISPDRWP